MPLGLAAPGAGRSWGGCLLGLAQVAGAGAALLLLPAAWWRWLPLAVAVLLWAWRQRQRPPTPTPEPPAWLLLYPDRLVLQAASGQQACPLDARTRVRLTYEGYRGEVKSLWTASASSRSQHTGYDNLLQLNQEPPLTFFVPDQAAEDALRQQLRHWYTRHVDVQEYRLYDGQPGNRTLLLRHEPDYDEQMQLLHACGFSLYGRPKP